MTTRHQTMSRRVLLGSMGTMAAGSMVTTAKAQEDSAIPRCIAVPRQTEGPYYVDEQLQRPDIRHDPTDDSTREGLPLQLTLTVSGISGQHCTPLSGATVDLWHCDALGEYSDVRDRRYDNRGRQFLRGYQILDADGRAQFTTIYPGWYPGRTVHLHFKIRTENGQEFTSQLYFDDDLTDRVHQLTPYAANPFSDSGQRSTRNDNDRIYQRGDGERLMLELEEYGDGMKGEFALGLVG